MFDPWLGHTKTYKMDAVNALALTGTLAAMDSIMKGESRVPRFNSCFQFKLCIFYND